MNLAEFSADGAARWAELERLCAKAGARPDRRLDGAEIHRLAQLYRSAAADLALARRRFPAEAVTASLEALVGRGRAVVYAAPERSGGPRAFASRGYWQAVRAKPWSILVAAVLLFGPWTAAAFWAHGDPGRGLGVIPEGFRSIAQPRTDTGSLGLDAAGRAAFASQIFTHNIGVSLLAVAGGMTLGLLTAASLVGQGVIFGAITGLAVRAGNTDRLVELTAPHGLLELSCLVVAASAGLRLGWVIVDPGPLPRGPAAAAQARQTVEVAIGTAVWLVVAGLLEGFVTPQGVGPRAALAIGAAAALAFWALVLWRGGAPADRAPERARPRRRRRALRAGRVTSA
ncbi:MAG: stage II sporulation protein M [Acidimicrobiales bacterium]